MCVPVAIQLMLALNKSHYVIVFCMFLAAITQQSTNNSAKAIFNKNLVGTTSTSNKLDLIGQSKHSNKQR